MSEISVLLPLPRYGFDPTEVAIPWKLLTEKGYKVVFTTPDGKPAEVDRLMVTGERLGIWKPLLRARKDAVTALEAMQASHAFTHPIAYTATQMEDYTGLYLPGGHDKGVREYLESPLLQRLTADFFSAKKPVAAICHGVVLAARSINPDNGKSVLYDYTTTALLKTQELLAHKLTKLWLQDYYLTYPGTTVEEEVMAVLKSSEQFVRGPTPALRDDLNHLARGFTVRDRSYLSARWPGDVYCLSLDFIDLLSSTD